MEILIELIDLDILTAMLIAISASVTVSMGEETNGVFSVIFFVSLDSK
jgi:hypothetical protein